MYFSYLNTKESAFYSGIAIKADPLVHDDIVEAVELKIPRGSNILDWGCGEGALSQRLSDLGYNVVSVDVAQDGFKAKSKFEPIDFNDPEQTTNFLNRYANTFDAVIGVEVIEHVENPWQYIRDLKCCLKDNGWLFLSTPNITSWYSRANFLIYGRFHQFEDNDRKYGHINPIAPDEMHYILSNTGFTNINLQPSGWLPRIWLCSDLRASLFNIFGYLLSFLMKQMKTGWCYTASAQKSDVESGGDKLSSEEYQFFWKKIHSDTVNDMAAVCFPDKPRYFNAFFDSIQRFAIARALRDIGFSFCGDTLDLGCGRGRWLKFWKKRGLHPIGLDISKDAVTRCNNLGYHALCGSVEQLPFETETLDVVSSITVLLHTPPDVKSRAIEEIVRVLKPGGKAILIESTWSNDPSPHVFPLSLDEWCKAFEQHGMRSVWIEGHCYNIVRRNLWQRVPFFDRVAISLDWVVEYCLMTAFKKKASRKAMQHLMIFEKKQ
ncbi:methyltransferase domain-containing protein [Oleidesulfovibrio sp.]|uniref:methyltransferase domain-containing protein n=1 Tax=Oleidesulfovibrio sp. TaxID=2909707 RepID=UPI003A8604EA